MDIVDNNQFEVKPINSKRKIATPCPNVYLNPALDILMNEDPMCNTAMEIVPNKKRKRTKSCDIATFENNALDLGISKAAVNEFLVRELENVKRNLKYDDNIHVAVSSDNTPLNSIPESSTGKITFDNSLRNPLSISTNSVNIFQNAPNDTIENDLVKMGQNAVSGVTEPIYANLRDVVESKTNTDTENTIDTLYCPDVSTIPHEGFDINSGISVLEQKSITAVADNDFSNISNTTNIQTNVTNQVIINNSNLSLSFIDRLALDSPNVSNQSLYLDDDLNESNIMEIKTITIITKKKRIVDKKNTNPFLDSNLMTNEVMSTTNPFIDANTEIEYHEEMMNRPVEAQAPNSTALIPRKLFDTNSTVSTMNDSSAESHEYENIDTFRADSPIYENIDEANCNKPSKVLGYDVSHFSAIDIMNLNKMNQANSSNESQDSKKDHKHSFLKAGNKLSKKVFKTLKKTFKHDKVDANATLNPYEVPRKLPKQKEPKKESGIENPALNLDNSDDLEIEELSDEEHQYETVKTRRNTQLNMNVTPLRVKDNDIDFLPNKTNTPGKKVRFDSTLNQEKVITGNSFDYGMQSPGFDAKIDKYHDELENCINERKFLRQNM